jgi:hypothetical protein
VSAKTARSSAVTIAFLAAAAIVVNAAPASAPMTFQKYPDAFGGRVAHHAVMPLWREQGTHARPMREVRCAAPAAVAAGTTCFVAGP